MIDRPDDPAPDPRLLAALRHAPDSDLQPGAELGEALRRAARAAVAPPPTGRWRRWLAAIDPGRHPALAGVLGGVLIAGVVVGLWKDQPMPAAVGPADARPGPSPAANMASAPPASQEARSAPSPAPATDTAEPFRARPPAAPGESAKRTAEGAERAPESIAPTAPAAPAVAVTPAAVPAPRAEATAPPSAAAAIERDAASHQDAARLARASAAGAARSAEPREPLAPTATPALLLALRQVPAAATARDASAPIADAEEWSWTRAPGEPQPLDDAARAWFARLDRATDGRWRRIDAAPADGPATVALRRGDARASVSVLADAVIWREQEAIYRADVAVAPPPPAVIRPARAASAR